MAVVFYCLYLIVCHNILLVFSGSVDLELIVISIVLHTSRVALALFYCPPNSSVSVFDSLLSTLYSNIDV